MKKWLLLALAIGLVVAVWLYVRELRITPEWNKPKIETVKRGDIRVPVVAAGLIEPLQRIEVKSKASGEVIELPVKEGNFVKAGQVLVVLKRDDEERNVARAQAELDRASALLEQARVAVDQATNNLTVSRSRNEMQKQQIAMAQAELERVRAAAARGDSSNQQDVNALAKYQIDVEQQKVTAADIVTAELEQRRSAENVRLQEAAVRVAQKSLEDAQERLSETTIKAPTDAIVTDVNVREGEVIQGGQTTFTGGTILLRLADVSVLKVTTRVDEADYGRVTNVVGIDALAQMPGAIEAAEADAEGMKRRGGPVKLTVDAFPDLTFLGHVERVSPQGRLNAGVSIIQFDVQVVIDDPKRYKLPLGTQAQVEFTVESVQNAMIVPSEAVKTFNEQRGVWIKIKPEPGSEEQYGKKFIRCRFGITDGTNTEIVEAMDAQLETGQEIYTRLPVVSEKG
ncbi:MAG: HlyD family efflux transporter periplasmic adaptor subunit [Phycisphaerae bacterium]